MSATTDEFSFMLKPCEHGIGVFAVHPIAAGTILNLFRDGEDGRKIPFDSVPEPFRKYCLRYSEAELTAPDNFARMSVGCYLNHSESANATTATTDNVFDYRATRDIEAGEEVTINYGVLGEPEEFRESFRK